MLSYINSDIEKYQQEISKTPQEQLDQKFIRNYLERKNQKKNFILMSIRGNHFPFIPRNASQILKQSFNIKELNLSECGLVSLQNFPAMPRLEKLDLTMNILFDGQIKHLYMEISKKLRTNTDNSNQKLENLKILYLSQNRIRNRQTVIKVLKVFKKLEQVDFQDNPVSSNSLEYSALELFPQNQNLRIVDRYLVDGRDMESLDYQMDDDDRYEQMQKRARMMRNQIEELCYSKQKLQQFEIQDHKIRQERQVKLRKKLEAKNQIDIENINDSKENIVKNIGKQIVQPMEEQNIPEDSMSESDSYCSSDDC